MKLPVITPKQKYILMLLYSYRYLDRVQIQTSLHHKDKRRIIAWLKDLREKNYVEWIYSTDFTEKTKPAIYYLGINGIRYLRSIEEADHTPTYPIEEIRKRYRDNKRSRTFIDRNLLVANSALSLLKKNDAAGTPRPYGWDTEAHYVNPDHPMNFLAEHDTLRPQLCIDRFNPDGSCAQSYLLELFDATMPRYRVRYRLKAYVNFIDDGEWIFDGPQPIILIACPKLSDLIYAKRATRKFINDTYTEEDSIRIWFTTTEILKREGATAPIWEDGRLRRSI